LICGKRYGAPRAKLAATFPETRMQHSSLKIIHEEHAALAAMLRSIPLLIQHHHHAGTTPDFAALRAMLFYIDEFPEQRHHRKETELLFPKLRARTPLARDQLDRLDADHARGERSIRNLEHDLTAYEMMGESRRAVFENSAQRYLDFYLTHMRLEEEVIIPLAQKVLTEQDWTELDEAFEANRDPLTGHAPDDEYRALFSRIVNSVPAPIGLGKAD
jgi:hemerythrin-like domain-containing protein